MKNVTLKILAASTALVGFSAFAEGEVNSQAKAAFDSLTAQSTEMSGYAWSLVVLVMGAMLGIKLFKKFASRAS